MKAFLKVTFAAVFIGAFSSCATLTPAGSQVKIVDPVELPGVKEKCAYKGDLSGSASNSQDHSSGSAQALIDLKNQAANAGANVVISKLKDVKSRGLFGADDVINGQGFNCPADIAAKLTNAEAM